MPPPRRAGDHQAAQQAESQAGRILPLLGRRDPAYFTDLAPEQDQTIKKARTRYRDLASELLFRVAYQEDGEVSMHPYPR
jgi:hypothetical protein